MASSYVRSLDSMPATYTPLADSTQLLLNTPTPAPIMQMERPATLSPSSSSNTGPVQLSLPTALLVSLTAVLGVAVVAIAAMLCWMRQWKHAKRPRALRAHGRGQPAYETGIERAATIATSSVPTPRIGSTSDDATIVALEGLPSEKVYQVAARGPERGVGAARPPTIRSTAATDPGSVRAPSFRARLYAFFVGTRAGGGWMGSNVEPEDGRDPPPVYEPHMLPEYASLA
ncbi:hypothetical protein VTO73DRAFT_9017 [Trametes versicolor]